MKPISVIVVDDSALIRQMFCEMLSSEPDIVVIATASDPLDAREKIKQYNPDVLTLDIEMPKMDGLSFLEKIMTLRPMPVIMASSLTHRGADETIRALEIGAFDYVSKPVASQNRNTIFLLKDELVTKVRAAAKAKISSRGIVRNVSTPVEVVPYHPPIGKFRHIIAIGSSTGGVEALREIFLRLPANSPPIVITQHMPAAFTRSFAARLDGLSAVSVSEAVSHVRLQAGHAYLAPGDQHLKIMKVGGELVCKLEDIPPVSGHKPSVDVMFNSVAESVGANAIGVILTGMGKDGADGLLKMRSAGARTIGQDENSCVVYGMPRAAKILGAVEMELPIQNIPKQIIHLCEKL